MSLSHEEASRLAFIRYLHHQSVQQARDRGSGRLVMPVVRPGLWSLAG